AATQAVVGQIVGLLAAGLFATNGPHVVVNSHIAWSNCLTPLLTTLAFWALVRASGSQVSGFGGGDGDTERRGESVSGRAEAVIGRGKPRPHGSPESVALASPRYVL